VKTPDEQLNQFGWVLHVVGFGLTAVCCVFAFAFVVTPMQYKITAAAREANQLQLFLDRTEIIVSRESDLRGQLSVSRAQLSELQDRVPRTPRAGEFLRQLDELAKQKDLTILDYQPGQTIDHVTHSETQIEMAGKGNYGRLCRFLDGLLHLPRMCRIRTMRIQSVSDGDEYPIDLSLSIYFSDSESFVRLAPADRSNVAAAKSQTY